MFIVYKFQRPENEKERCVFLSLISCIIKIKLIKLSIKKTRYLYIHLFLICLCYYLINFRRWLFCFRKTRMAYLSGRTRRRKKNRRHKETVFFSSLSNLIIRVSHLIFCFKCLCLSSYTL